MTSKLSDDPRYKLQAVLNHDQPDPDDDLARAYRAECRAWFERLTEDEAWIAVMTALAYETDEDKAAELASALPPAPRRPL